MFHIILHIHPLYFYKAALKGVWGQHVHVVHGKYPFAWLLSNGWGNNIGYVVGWGYMLIERKRGRKVEVVICAVLIVSVHKFILNE